MPPRAQRLYPRMRERPPEFRVNQGWPLYDSLVLAAFPGRANAGYLAGLNYIPQGYSANESPIVWDSYLKRFVFHGPSTSNSAYIVLSPSGWVSGLVPPLTTFMWLYQQSFRYRVSVSELSTEGGYWGHSPQVNRASSGDIAAFWANTAGSNYTSVVSGVVMNSNVWYTVGVRYFPAASCYVNAETVASTGATSGTPRVCISHHLMRADNSLNGFCGDCLVWRKVISLEFISQLSDPSNVDLRVGGIPLILPPRRRLWPVAPVAEYIKRRQLGLRAGSREVVT